VTFLLFTIQFPHHFFNSLSEYTLTNLQPENPRSRPWLAMGLSIYLPIVANLLMHDA